MTQGEKDVLPGDGGTPETSATAIPERKSPVSELLGIPAAAELFDESDFDGYSEAMRSCMSSQGFEWYPPSVAPSDSQFDLSFADGAVRDTVDWARLYGFGVSTLWFPEDRVRSDLRGSPLGGQPDESRLDDYLGSLNEDEQRVWSRVESDCHAEVIDGHLDRNPSWATLAQEIAFADPYEEIEGRLFADERYSGREAEIKSCIADAGFDPKFVFDIEQLETYLDNEFSAHYSTDPAGNLTEAALTKLGELQAWEIRLAEAVIACGENPSNLAKGKLEIYDELLFAYEEDFVERFRSELEALSLEIDRGS